MQVTNRQTSKTVNTIPVETPVMITTNELVDGVISKVDLLPVTALESVTRINMRIESWRHHIILDESWYILYSISCTICKTLKPLYLIYDLDSHNVKIYSKVLHMLRVTTSLLRSLCKKWFSFQNDTQSNFRHDKLTSVIPYIINHIFFSNTITRADWYDTLEDNS